MSVFDGIKESLNNVFNELPITYQKSKNWKEYHLGATITHCLICLKRDNKIFLPKMV